MRKPIRISLLLSAAACALAFSPFHSRADEPAAAGYQVIKTFPVGGDGRWDYVNVDPAAKLLYVPRQTHTMILKEETGEVVADLKDTSGVHGVALATDAGRGYASNGKANTVTVFDLKTNQVLATVPAGQKPDAIIYDPASKCVFCMNGGSNNTTVIDTTAASDAPAKATIELGGAPEFAASDGAGHVYINLEDKSEVVAIDTKTMKVTDTWKIDGGDGPSGLAIDAANHHLFSGCHNQVMAIIDTQTGKVIGTVPIGAGVDACGFDAGTSEAFASCGDGTLTVAKISPDGKVLSTQTVKTPRGARTMTIDPITHTIYLPTADMEAPAAGGQRPTPKAGTFKIVVVGHAEK